MTTNSTKRHRQSDPTVIQESDSAEVRGEPLNLGSCQGSSQMYRYLDRDIHGNMAPENADERVLLEAVEASRMKPELVEQYSASLAEARQKFLKLKMQELRECLREAGLIQMSIDQMLVSQAGRG